MKSQGEGMSVKLDRHWIGTIVAKRTETIISLLLFVTCLFVYLANGSDLYLGSSDNIPNTLLAFNWLENHSLTFNLFKDGQLYVDGEHPYFFAEGLNGDLTSRYPIGTAIITFPLYVVFFLYLKLTGFVTSLATGIPTDFLDLASKDFESQRIDFSKLAGSISTAFATVLFYLTLRLKFDRGIALISSFIFAFCTSSWALNSQDLRQHTISNLVLITIIFCLMKADRTQNRKRQVLLFLAGIFCGLLPSVRLTSGLFSFTATIYTLYVFRKEAIYFLLGLPSVLLHFAWNAYYFGWDNLISGGYIEQLENRPSTYKFTIEQFTTAAPGLLIAPSEGLFAFSPVLLFSIPGAYQVFQHRSGRDEKLLICLTIAALGIFVNYSFYGSWTGGSDSYGCRFLTDIIPILCLLVAYFLTALISAINQTKARMAKIVFAVFLSSIFVSTSVQAIGVYTSTDWGTSPIPLLLDRSRLWQISDSQIERHFRNLTARITKPIPNPKQYVLGLDGRVEKVEIVTREGEVTDVSQGFELYSKRRRLIRVTLRNTGQSQWFGYQTGMQSMGETKLRIFFISEDGQTKTRPREGKNLNISGTPKPGEQTEALSRVMFPQQPGNYQMVFEVFASGLNDSFNQTKPPIYSVPVKILARNND